jgi:glycerol kinase
MDNEELTHLGNILDAHTRRLRILEVRQARQGLHAPPEVVMEIEDLREEIARVQRQIDTFPQEHRITPALDPSQTANASDTKRKLIEISVEVEPEKVTPEFLNLYKNALAAMAGVSPDKVIIRNSIIGSLILVLELPDEAADTLLQLFASKDPVIEELGIQNIRVVPQTTNETKARRQVLPGLKFVAAIDQGTTSTRFMIFGHDGLVVAIDQKEHEQIYPKPGWVEHDPMEIWKRTEDVIEGALRKSGISPKEIAAVGITNQRETVVVWDKATGKPVYNAIVWQDTRTDAICNELAKAGGQDRFREKVGLPLATYFSGPKIKWILDNVQGVREKAEKGEVLFGNIDTWVIWNLSGGPKGGVHVTDVSNASRTMLMNLETLDWDPDVLAVMSIPRDMLPKIRPSSEVYTFATGVLDGVPVASDLGDQQAALFGQVCFNAGEAKNTYGTGCFMLLNTGTKPVQSKNGLLTTLGYKIGDQAAVYCLEGSIAITGGIIHWLRDNLKLIEKSSDVEALARTVDDNGGIYFVPAFSGLFAPYWRSDARGVIVGLTRYINRGHIARAALEATAFQTREVLDAMSADSGVPLTALKVDGGLVYNDLLMQFQADVLGVPVVRPKVAETTALGAAYAAGLAVSFWKTTDEIRENWRIDKIWEPTKDSEASSEMYRGWKKAVARTFDWVE